MSDTPHSEWHSDDELASSLEDVMGRLGKVEAAADASDTGRVELLEQAAAEAAVAVDPISQPAQTSPEGDYSNQDSAEVTAIIESYIVEEDDDEGDPTDAFAAYYAEAASQPVAAEPVTPQQIAPQQDAPPSFAPAGYVPGQTDEVIGEVVVEEVILEEVTSAPITAAPITAATVTPATTSTTSTMFHVSDTRYEKPKRASFDEVFFGRPAASASTPSEQ